jgi:hypothetical protein
MRRSAIYNPATRAFDGPPISAWDRLVLEFVGEPERPPREPQPIYISDPSLPPGKY